MSDDNEPIGLRGADWELDAVAEGRRRAAAREEKEKKERKKYGGHLKSCHFLHFAEEKCDCGAKQQKRRR